ncbi:MAG TPA: 2'-5' RNA ligase family protein [Coleofasciculaceae cyanobacterium]
MAALFDRKGSRFFIALIPPLEIQAYANLVIQELSDRYKTSTSNAPPHVTLQAPFLWHLDAMPQLEACISQFAQSQPAVPVTLSGFGAFPPRVLYINVLKTPELLSLQTGLMGHLEETLGILDPVAKRRPFSPHLTVASRNLAATFQVAWSDLQSRSVDFEFVGDRLTLLLHDGQCWQIQSQFPCGQSLS